jgi:DNA processing protein
MPSEAWLTLLQSGETRAAVWRRALGRFASADDVVSASTRDLLEIGLAAPVVDRLKQPSSELLESWSRWLDDDRHTLLTITDASYPKLLSEIADPPIALWIAGDRTDRLSDPQLAIVGSRNASAGGIANARAFARFLGQQGCTITSGLALGIDGAAHRGALGTLGGTLAVLGSGPDVIYPRQHEELAKAITAEDGLLVSEYAPETPPARYRFPARNRIIAGLSAGVLVVEAGRQSGSLITASLAAEYGREVFAIPGSIHNPLSRGCHFLIRQGAMLVEDASQVLAELAALLDLDAAEPLPKAPSESPLEIASEYAELLAIVGFDPRGINEIVAESGLTAAEVSSMLLVLELRGQVEAMPGGRYVRTS